MGAIINYSLRVDKLPKEKFYRRKRQCGLCKPYNVSK